MAMAQPVAARRSVPGWVAWLGFVVLCNAAGFLSSLAAREQTVYADLHKPFFAPPPWVFAPAWTTLYVLMGTATYLVWRDSAGAPRRRALTVFGAQLALNALWTPVFFALQQYSAALALLVAIWIAVAAMLVLYAKQVRLAGLLIIPLLLWVTYAGALNAAIVALN